MNSEGNRWRDSHWDTPPGDEVAAALMTTARHRYDALKPWKGICHLPAAQKWLASASERDRARMDSNCDEEAEQGARLVSEYSLAECFLGVCCGGSVQEERPVVGVAGENIPEAGIQAGQLLGEVDGSDYCPAPA